MSEAENSWHAAFPPVQCQHVSEISRLELLHMIRNGKQAGIDYLLVDVRRNDHEGGTIRGSINLPAQTLHPSIPTLYSMMKQAKLSQIMFYCGSSRGRGPRAAGWFDDYIKAQGDEDMTSHVLVGGIKGWAGAGQEYVAFMDGYDKNFWGREDKAATKVETAA